MTFISENNEKRCGCKGVRFCGLCLHTERVKKLQIGVDKYNNYQCFIYYPKDNQCYPSKYINSKSSMEEIARLYQEIPSKERDVDDEVLKLDGLLLIEDFITESEEEFLVNRIDKKDWVPSQSGRRKQVTFFV